MAERATVEPMEHDVEAEDIEEINSSDLESSEEEDSELDDLEDRRRPLRFIDTFLELPLDTLDNHAHIVNTRGFDEDVNADKAKAIDAAVTLLYNYDPEVLKKFLDPRIERFTWRRHRKGPFQEVVVLRRKKLVQMGFKDENGRWDDAGIQYKGDDLLRTWKLDHVEQYGAAGRTQFFNDMVTSAFAKAIYYNRPWEKDGGFEFTLEAE